MSIKIFIDQGHNPSGNHNTGAEGNGLFEQDITYNVGEYLSEIISKDPRFEVKVSRPTPNTVLGTNNSSSLKARVDAANSWGADYFLSIHVNASVNTNANGSECYVYSSNSKSYYLATSILNSIVASLKTKNNGVLIRPSLYVLRKSNMPAVLIELAYISNYSDAQKLRNNQFQFAQAIYIGLLNYLKLN